MSVKNMIIAVAQARAIAEIAKTKLGELSDKVQATPEFQAENAQSQVLLQAVNAMRSLEDDLRRSVEEAYRATGDKNPASSVSVKLYKHINYDTEAAISWAIQYAPTMVVTSLSKSFDKVAVELGAPVTVTYEPRVQIATDLSEWVAAVPDGEHEPLPPSADSDYAIFLKED